MLAAFAEGRNPCSMAGMKLILRISNVVPLFMAFLILSTVWKLGWQHLGASAKSRWAQAIAGAAATQL